MCGTIDIEKALTEGVKAFEPGLLVREHFPDRMQTCSGAAVAAYMHSVIQPTASEGQLCIANRCCPAASLLGAALTGCAQHLLGCTVAASLLPVGAADLGSDSAPCPVPRRPRRTGASCMWTRSTCWTTTWWMCCWTRRPRGGTPWSGRASPSATLPASSSSAQVGRTHIWSIEGLLQEHREGSTGHQPHRQHSAVANIKDLHGTISGSRKLAAVAPAAASAGIARFAAGFDGAAGHKDLSSVMMHCHNPLHSHQWLQLHSMDRWLCRNAALNHRICGRHLQVLVGACVRQPQRCHWSGHVPRVCCSALAKLTLPLAHRQPGGGRAAAAAARSLRHARRDPHGEGGQPAGADRRAGAHHGCRQLPLLPALQILAGRDNCACCCTQAARIALIATAALTSYHMTGAACADCDHLLGSCSGQSSTATRQLSGHPTPASRRS